MLPRFGDALKSQKKVKNSRKCGEVLAERPNYIVLVKTNFHNKIIFFQLITHYA